jgi:hypothetical protein
LYYLNTTPVQPTVQQIVQPTVQPIVQLKTKLEEPEQKSFISKLDQVFLESKIINKLNQ